MAQFVRGELSDYHRTTAHHIAVVMLPAIFSMIVKCLYLQTSPLRITIGASIVCICLNIGLLGIQIARLNQSCFFGGIVASDPIAFFPTILTAGIVSYFLFLPVCATVQLVKRFAEWRTKWPKTMFTISILAQIAAILSTVGFISFIELDVRSAQPFLVGGSENTWGFGQILAITVLILPTVELLEDGFSQSEEHASKRKLRYWIDMQSERIRKGNYPDACILMMQSLPSTTKSFRIRGVGAAAAGLDKDLVIMSLMNYQISFSSLCAIM